MLVDLLAYVWSAAGEDGGRAVLVFFVALGLLVVGSFLALWVCMASGHRRRRRATFVGSAAALLAVVATGLGAAAVDRHRELTDPARCPPPKSGERVVVVLAGYGHQDQCRYLDATGAEVSRDVDTAGPRP